MVCSPNCAVLLIKTRIHDTYIYNNKYKLIQRLATAMTGVINPIIHLPDDPVGLTKHGGPISDASYQKKIYNINPELIAKLYASEEDFIEENQS
jgi:hypothetical protein